jgi:DNA-binding MarR family transcriptional regulator
MVVPGLTPEEERELSQRIAAAWKELRRGAAMAAGRDHLFGAGADALEPGQFDTLELLVQRDGWRMSEMADALRVDPSTATRAVQRLLKTGWPSATLRRRRPGRDGERHRDRSRALRGHRPVPPGVPGPGPAFDQDERLQIVAARRLVAAADE